MQKFTVFSILFSVSVVLVIVDLVVHDYMSADPQADIEDIHSMVEEVSMELPTEVDLEMESETSEDSDEPMTDSDSQETDTSEPNDTLDPVEEPNTDDVELSEILILDPTFNEGLLLESGFGLPTLKDTIFSGLVFQMIPFSDQVDPFVYQWNFFDGEEFIGSIYELRYETETGSFQGYLNLRDRAQALTQMGTVNEVNLYGDANFYFNHTTKTKTVHMVLRNGSQIYAFEYAYKHHDKMKAVFETLGL